MSRRGICSTIQIQGRIRLDRRLKTLFTVVMVPVLFFLMALFPDSSVAVTSNTRSFQAFGTISYALSPPRTNLAMIPDDWHLTYGTGPQIIFLDYDVVHTPGNPSIRLEAHTSADANTYREIDGPWLNANPGDHVVTRVWIKTGISSTGDTRSFVGGRLGADFYIHAHTATYGDVYGVPWRSDAAWDNDGIYPKNVVWGKDWTLVEFDIILPTRSYSYVGISRPEIPAGTPIACDPVQLDSFVLWLDAREIGDLGKVWFADAELYINP
jgi:hypothetical protein